VRSALGAMVAVAAAGLVVGGCGDEKTGSATTVEAGTALSIVLFPKGRDSTARKTWALQCDPDQGTLPSPEKACDALRESEDVLAPPPDDLACTEIYGGPQVIEVTGLRQGVAIRVVFTRADGCQIAAFDRVATAFGLSDAIPRG
jgi:Subtilisin inhibitor-like